MPSRLSKLRFSPTTTIRCWIGVVAGGVSALAGAPSRSAAAATSVDTPPSSASTVESRQVLRDEIAADHLHIGIDQSLGDRTRSPAGAKGSAVQAAHAADAQARRGQKAFIGGVRVVKVDVLRLERDL